MGDCEHKFIYKGAEYEVASHSLPGTGAKAIYYYEAYFCEKCLLKKHQVMPGGDGDHTYNDIKYNATPKVK